MNRKKAFTLTLLSAMVLLLAAGIVVRRSVWWRMKLVGLYVGGRIPDVDPADIVSFVKPGTSGYVNMAHLVETRNPFATLNNPLSSEKDWQLGGELFGANCSTCHGAGGKGGAT